MKDLGDVVTELRAAELIAKVVAGDTAGLVCGAVLPAPYYTPYEKDRLHVVIREDGIPSPSCPDEGATLPMGEWIKRAYAMGLAEGRKKGDEP